ncbi:MAG: endolytic transglycosylase MltG [Candidatus Dadabacteria bacterium]
MKFKMRAVIIIGIISIAFLAGFVYSTYFVSPVPQRTKKVTIEIPKHSGLKSIALELKRAEVIRSDKLFILSVLLRGDKSRLKAGEYEFEPGDSLNEIIEKLVRGDVVVHRITIPEGFTMNEIAELLERNGIMSKEAFLERARSAELARELLGAPSLTSLEGYLFPDSYSYKKGITPDELIRMMVARFKEVYMPLRTNSGGLDLTDHEIVTLASIIEKETGNISERPLVSAVFHNRLKLGMRLESDPTVIYGIDSFDGNLRKKDLKAETRYNTYVIFGLPPGPISNPGRDSLEAALNPAHVNYLYFVSKGDGTHEFSSNYRDHRRAVIEYQKGLGSNGKKPQ